MSCSDVGELLNILPSGIDKAVAISKVVQLLRSPHYAHFQHQQHTFPTLMSDFTIEIN